MLTEELRNAIIEALDLEHCQRLLKIYAGLNAPMPISALLNALADQEQT
jgi:hypothetical protein